MCDLFKIEKENTATGISVMKYSLKGINKAFYLENFHMLMHRKG